MGFSQPSSEDGEEPPGIVLAIYSVQESCVLGYRPYVPLQLPTLDMFQAKPLTSATS